MCGCSAHSDDAGRCLVAVGFGDAVVGTHDFFRPVQQLTGEDAAAVGGSELP